MFRYSSIRVHSYSIECQDYRDGLHFFFFCEHELVKFQRETFAVRKVLTTFAIRTRVEEDYLIGDGKSCAVFDRAACSVILRFWPNANQCRRFIGRYATYTGAGFQEGVSLTCADEVIRLRKYAYGACEMLLNKFKVSPVECCSFFFFFSRFLMIPQNRIL